MQPINVRLNNPGNMRGKTGAFQNFATPDEGLLAMRNDLLKKVSGQSNAMAGRFGQGYQPTLSNVITTWAPPEENDTQSYINFVSQKSGLNPNQVLTQADIDRIIPAMIEQEGGGKAASYYKMSSLSPEEEAELAQLEAEFGGLSPEEESELSALENEFALDKKYGPPAPSGDYFKDRGIDGNNGGAGRAFAYGVTGGQIPFGNRITSALGATYANVADGLGLIPDTSWKDLYEQSLADTKVTQEANPGATLAGNIAGIATTLPLASTKVLAGTRATQGVRGAINAIPEGLAAVGNFARSGKAAKDAGILAKAGSLALRSAKGAAVAAPVGAAYSAGEADPGDMLNSALSGMGLAAGVGAALPIAGAVLGTGAAGLSNIGKGIVARSSDDIAEAGNKIRLGSEKAYSRMRDVGAVINQKASQKIAFNLEQKLKSDGPLNARLHDKVLSVFGDIKEAFNKGDVGLEEMDQWRQLLGDVAGDFNDKINARKAKLLMKELDNTVNSLTGKDLSAGTDEAITALNLGRQEYSKFSRFRTVSEILEKADGDPNKIKSGLDRLLNNKKKVRGFSDDEIAALRNAAKYTAGEGITKALGKFGFDLGTSQTMGNTALPVLGGFMTGGKLTAAGTAARQTQKYLARGKAEQLLRVIENGGTPPISQIMKLPPKQAKALLEMVRKTTNVTTGAVPRASALQQ